MATRHAERVLNYGPGPPEDGEDRRRDTCPGCGAERWELLGPPDVFYCDACKKGTVGPNTEGPKPKVEQIDLFAATIGVPKEEHLAEEGPPIDEGMAWVGEERPDE